MRSLMALIWKEWVILARDPHGLAVLFVMPAIFILVMSIALQDVFGDDSGRQAGQVGVVDQAQDEMSSQFLSRLEKRLQWFEVKDSDHALGRDEVRIRLSEDFHERLLALMDDAGESPKPVLERWADATVDGRSLQLIDGQIRMALGEALSQVEGDGEVVDLLAQLDQHAIESIQPGGRRDQAASSSVQQSVPAWLVFGMFFVVIPLSTVLIAERQQGTLDRLRLMGVGPLSLLSAKVPAYFLINLLQLAVMLAIGFWLLPLLGAEALQPPAHLPALLLVASASSLAAIAFALLVAVIAQTHMQATTAGGVFNILFAATGGIMVPRFVMAEPMQAVSWLSPMGWSLDGFLAAFMRADALSVILPPLLGLLLFALACFVTAALIVDRRA